MDQSHRDRPPPGYPPTPEEARTAALLRENQTLLDNAFVGVLVVQNHCFIRTNHRAEMLFGYAPGELIGRSTAIIFPDHAAFLALSERADPLILSGAVFTAEVELVRKDGSRLWSLMRAQALAPGEPAAEVLWVMKDVTDRKRSQAALEANLAFQKELLEAIPAPVFFKDMDGRYQGVNRAFTELFGRAESALIGKTVYDCWPRDIADLFWAKDQALLQNPGVQVYEAQIKNHQGELRSVVFHKATYHAPDGGLCGLIGFILDITERKAAADALRTSEERLQLALDGSHDGFWDWNVATGAVLYSERWVEMLGYQMNELKPHLRFWKRLMHPDDQANARAALLAHFAGETPRYQNEHRMRTKSGEWRWFLQRGRVTTRDGQGRPLRMAGTYTDITERRHMQEALCVSLAEVQRHGDQLMELNRMNDRLLSCQTRAQAHAIVARSAGRLFRGYGGALAVFGEGTDAELQVAAAWGDQCQLPASFPPHHCWALRRGADHEVQPPAHAAHCRHFRGPPPPVSLCLPLTVRGETFGLLHLCAANALSAAGFADLRTLATTFGESVKLALSNIRLQEALREQAIRDPLTGLFNRRYLDETLPRELHLSRRRGEPLAVAMLDLDHFKGLNDSFGHEAGDAVLRAIGALLLGSLRAGDIACRYGGEELTLILPGATLDAAQTRLEHLRQAIMGTRLVYQGGGLPTVTVSIGVSAAADQDRDATALLARADAALYRAKRAGRNRVIVAAA